MADSLIKKGWELTTVRKLMQCLASGGAGACMLVCVLASSATVQVASLTAALAMSNLSTVGLYCSHQVGASCIPKFLTSWHESRPIASLANHPAAQRHSWMMQDISPKYAGVMLSITNTFGSLPGMLGNLLVGTLMDITVTILQAFVARMAPCRPRHDTIVLMCPGALGLTLDA